MARRVSFTVRVHGRLHRLPGWRWRNLVERNLLRVTGARQAVAADGVHLYLEGGSLRIVCLQAASIVHIGSAWDLVERQALYDLRGQQLTPDALQREIQAQYCERAGDG